MKKISVIFMVLMAIMVSTAFADTTKTVQPTITWNGQGADGKVEGSYPVTLNLYQDGTTPALKSTLSVATGSVTNANMPTFTVVQPDNLTSTYNYYATATDSAGNISGKSAVVSLTIVGKDSIAPSSPTITITITIQP